MTEIERIEQNVNRELPEGKYFILRVEDIDNAKDVLEHFKQSMINILQNYNIHYEDKRWLDLLPKDIVEVTVQFDDEDYKNDDLLQDIYLMVKSVFPSFGKRKWEVYSSKLYSDGLEVIFSGDSKGVGPLNFIRFHKPGIPLEKITIEADEIVYPLTTMVYKDVMSYRSF